VRQSVDLQDKAGIRCRPAKLQRRVRGLDSLADKVVRG
jgi:hypothetical protein